MVMILSLNEISRRFWYGNYFTSEYGESHVNAQSLVTIFYNFSVKIKECFWELTQHRSLYHVLK
ncbi:unnamed protein product, partial [Tenebrio molitor]